jgi:hypothetical protein
MKDMDLLCPEFCLSGRLNGEIYLSNGMNYLSHLKEFYQIKKMEKKERTPNAHHAKYTTQHNQNQ